MVKEMEREGKTRPYTGCWWAWRQHCSFRCRRYGGRYVGSFFDDHEGYLGELVGISTIVAVTVAAIALLVRMISRNQRAVEESNRPGSRES